MKQWIEADYQECSWYIKNVLGITLFPYQEHILKAFCDGLEVRTARGIGRSMVAKCFGDYVAHNTFLKPSCRRNRGTEEDLAKHISHFYDKNNFHEQPDIIFPYTCALKCDVMNDEHIALMKELLSEKEFDAEYLCIHKSDF